MAHLSPTGIFLKGKLRLKGEGFPLKMNEFIDIDIDYRSSRVTHDCTIDHAEVVRPKGTIVNKLQGLEHFISSHGTWQMERRYFKLPTVKYRLWQSWRNGVICLQSQNEKPDPDVTNSGPITV
jgi:hypothetical protein